jgi:hypothetical protein
MFFIISSFDSSCLPFSARISLAFLTASQIFIPKGQAFSHALHKSEDDGSPQSMHSLKSAFLAISHQALNKRSSAKPLAIPKNHSDADHDD